MSLFKNITKSTTVGVSLLSLAVGVSSINAHADSIPAQFEIESGVLTLKFIAQTDYNTTSAQPTYKFADFPNASAINMYTNGDIATNGTTKPTAATTEIGVKGNVVIGFLNGSGKGFTSNTTLTNFSSGGKVLPLCNAAGAPCTGVRMSTQANAAVASTSTDYAGQGVAAPTAPSSELLAAQNITNLTDLTATGVSNAFPLLNFADGAGNGEFYKKTQLNYTIPAFAQTGNYVATYTVTGIVNP